MENPNIEKFTMSKRARRLATRILSKNAKRRLGKEKKIARRLSRRTNRGTKITSWNF